jgi:serine/threonine protein phosphatase PrpC
MLVCTDGLWSGVEDKDFALVGDADTSVEKAIRVLADRAVANNSPHSDNTSVTAARWRGA